MDVKLNEKEAKEAFRKTVRQIPFATSRAMQKTIIKAVAEAKKAAREQLDRPTPVIVKEGVNKGAIRGQWPRKAEIARGFKRADGMPPPASVFVLGKGAAGGKVNSRRLDLIDELHPVVYGGRVDRVPFNSRAVLTPTNALLKGLSGKGRLKKLNKYGNIAGFRNGLLKRIKDNSKLYLNVPLNSPDPNFAHISPGLYFKGREISKGGMLRGGVRGPSGRLSRSARNSRRLIRTSSRLPADPVIGGRRINTGPVSARGRAKRKQGRIVNYLVMLIAYDEVRTYKRKFKFDTVVLESYQKTYKTDFIIEFSKAIKTAK